MKSLFFVLGLVLYACDAHCEDCSEDAGMRCMLPLVEGLREDGIDCEKTAETKYCLKNLTKQCKMAEEERYMVYNIVNEINSKIDNLCLEDFPEEAQAIIKCAGEKTPIAMTTCGKHVDEEQSDIQSDDEQDARCITFLRVFACASKKVADDCNASNIAEYLENAMILGLKSSKLRKHVESPRCSAAIYDAVVYSATTP